MFSAQFFATWSPRMLAILRIAVALIFLEHGTQKLFGFPASPRPTTFDLTTLPTISALIELIVGALLLVGFQTRLVAFIVSGEMAFAYFIAHHPRNLFPVLNGGDAAILYCFVFLYLCFAGPGTWSLDTHRRPA